MRIWYRLLAVALLCAATGCGGGEADEPASTLSKAERDSVLGASNLPGAATVRGALDVADSAQVRADRAEDAAEQ